jgi:hypothetical protein
MSALRGYAEHQTAILKMKIIERMAYVGESCVRVGRFNGTYRDQTGNLRSSVGYVIVSDGNTVQASGFEQVAAKRDLGPKEKADGGKQGEEFAKELAGKYPKGIVLIMVAGMKYAAAVADMGKDVLDSAENEADRLLPVMFGQLGLRR